VLKENCSFIGALFLCGLAVVLTGCSSSATKLTNLGNTQLAYQYHAGAGPTVVFQAGLGDGQSTWSSVVAKLPPTQSYFTYDRPGYGSSGKTTAPRDPCSIATEQHQLLVQSGVKAPYVLVGHSIGGLYEYVYALKYPDEVAGIILLDPTHPEHWKSLESDAPLAAGLVKTMRYTVFSMAARAEFDAQEQCLASLPPKLPASLAAHTQLLVSTKANPGEQGAFQVVLSKLRQDWLRLTGVAQLTPVADSTHYIQKDRPDAVLTAIGKLTAKQ